MNEHTRPMQGFFKFVSWTGLIAGGLLLIPFAVWLALQLFGIAPNPRHPPIDLKEETLGWTLIAAFFGLACTIIAESTMMSERTTLLGRYRGLLVGGGVALLIGCFVTVAMAVITRASVDGQGITSTYLAVAAGLLVGIVGVVGGAMVGTACKRIVNFLSS